MSACAAARSSTQTLDAMQASETTFSALVIGKRCLRIRKFEFLFRGTPVGSHFSLLFDLEGGDAVRAIFDLDVFFRSAGAAARPLREHRVVEVASLHRFAERSVNRVDFEIDSALSKKLHLGFVGGGTLTYWEGHNGSKISVNVSNDT
jgi:hypothetical protein